jgi:cellulose synthase/poly-beta-1,6-N-acetylglucosamine synthase-like glycosyltransferase
MEKVSIIIPCRDIGSMAIDCIRACLNLDYDDFEIIVLPDETNKKSKNPKLKIIETGKVKPSFKRNKGMEVAEGDFYAFIDDDAYPRKDWLKKAMNHFKNDYNKKIGIVGGPNLTPPDANFAEKVSGYVSSNFWVSGPANIRYKISKNRYTEELPSCNYISRKEASSEYDSCFLTAEDSRFCFICRKRGYKVLYSKDVIVYHHRRKSLWKHLKQHYIFGRDIAWLTKKEFSFSMLFYAIMTLFVIGFLTGFIWSFFDSMIRMIFIYLLEFYLIVMLLTSLHENVKTSFYVFIVSIETHFVYGFGYLIGIFSGPEKTEKVIWNSR